MQRTRDSEFVFGIVDPPEGIELVIERAFREKESKFALRFFYSPEQRIRPEAKTRFVEPDMASLPVPPSSENGDAT